MPTIPAYLEKLSGEIQNYLDSKIPVKFRNAKLEDLGFDHLASPLPSTVSSWSGDQWLILWGPPGSGKTTLAVALVRKWLEDRAKPIVGYDGASQPSFGSARIPGIYWLDMRTKMREASTSTEVLDEIIRKVTSARLTVVEDIGADRRTDHRADILASIIGTLEELGKRVIFTTNFPPSSWQLGDALESRVLGGQTIVFEVLGKYTAERRRRKEPGTDPRDDLRRRSSRIFEEIP